MGGMGRRTGLAKDGWKPSPTTAHQVLYSFLSLFQVAPSRVYKARRPEIGPWLWTAWF